MEVRKGRSGERPILNLENVASGQPRIVGDLARGVANDLVAFEPGDVLFSKLRPYLAKSLLVQEPMFGTAEFLSMRTAPSLDPKFLLYVTMSAPWLALAEMSGYGAKMPRTSWDALADFDVPLHPLEEQHRVTGFLDEQTTLLDRAIALREQQVSLLGERQNAMAARAIAGLDGEATTAQHPLLGPVREEWRVLRLKQVVQSAGVGVVVNPSAYFVEDGGVPFLHGGNVRDGYFDLEAVKRMSVEDSERLHRSRLQLGDVVVVRAGYPGRAAVVPPELVGANCASILLFRPDANQVLSHWIEMFFNSRQGRSQVSLVQYGAAQEQINLGDAVEFALPVPPLDTQQAVLAEVLELRNECARLKGLYERSLTLMRERKQALITAAITGQFDVTTARKVEVA